MIKAMKDLEIKEGATMEDYEDFTGLHNVYLGVGAMQYLSPESIIHESIILSPESIIQVFYQKQIPTHKV